MSWQVIQGWNLGGFAARDAAAGNVDRMTFRDLASEGSLTDASGFLGGYSLLAWLPSTNRWPSPGMGRPVPDY
ncbi:MAG: hypothetical protein R3B96_22525 [Pirellulaceae bacterium]